MNDSQMTASGSRQAAPLHTHPLTRRARRNGPVTGFACLAFLCGALPVSSFSQEAAPADDFYLRIAGQKVGERMKADMEVPGPAPVPQNLLAWNGGQTVQPMDKIDTPEKLAAALEEARQKFRPFLQEYAPALPGLRLVLPVTQMQFRLETAEDRGDFLHTLTGQGTWTNVSIPHYTGPGERAVAWYRTVFTLTDAMKARDRLLVRFNGVSYFADVFVNGHYIGGHQGYFGAFDLDFTPYAKAGQNVLLVKVRNSSRMGIGSSETGETNNRKHTVPRTFGDKIESSNSPGWDDPEFGWNCTPNGFGIYQGVTIETRSDLYLNYVFPRPDLAKNQVELTIEVENPSEANRTAGLLVSVLGRNFPQTVVRNLVAAGKKRSLAPSGKITRAELHNVNGTRCLYRVVIPMPNPRAWTLEEPWLYTAQVQLTDADGNVIDAMEKSFGMRSFEIRTDTRPIGRMFLNGQEIRLRGANEMGHFQLDVLRRNWDQLVDDILLAKITRMNFIRCTQTVMPQEFYDYCDRLGLMNQSDLPLFSKISHKQVPEVLRQTAEMARVVRSHPSSVLISFINEPDGGDGTGGYAFALNRAQVEQFMEAARIVVHLQNPDQTIKLVDGDYNPPSNGLPDNHCYSGWYGNHGVSLDRLYAGYWMSVRRGWMYGCGEFGVEGLDPINTMQKLYPSAWLAAEPDGSWKPDKIPGGQTWNMHRAWYKTPRTMEEWVEASQAWQAKVIQLKIEAFRRMTRLNTCAVHLFIDAWPDGWLKSIMDVQRQPKKAWFAYYNGLAPTAVQVRSDQQRTEFVAGQSSNVEIWICNDAATVPSCQLRYQLESEGKILQSGTAPAKVPTVSEGALCQGLLPISAPNVTSPTPMTLRVSLAPTDGGKLIDQYVFDCQAAPPR